MKKLTLKAITWFLCKLQDKRAYGTITVKFHDGKPVRVVSEQSAESDEELETLIHSGKEQST